MYHQVLIYAKNQTHLKLIKEKLQPHNMYSLNTKNQP